MQPEKLNNIKEYKAIDDFHLRNVYLDPFIKDINISRTGYINNYLLFSDFLVDHHILTYPNAKDHEKDYFLEKAKTLIKFSSFRGEKISNENANYFFFCDFTRLALEDKKLYFDVARNLEGNQFKKTFCHPSDPIFHYPTQKIYDLEAEFYEFNQPYSLDKKPAHLFYTYVKELQFFSNNQDMSEDAYDICNEGSRFLSKMGLMEKNSKKEEILELAESINLVPFAKNRLCFSVNLEKIQNIDLRITTALALKNEAFLCNASKITKTDKSAYKDQIVITNTTPKNP